MNTSNLPNPSRCRKIPPQFSWIDHCLVRLHYFERCSTDALALYLFLITVADARGLSYYGHACLIGQLKLSSTRLVQARNQSQTSSKAGGLKPVTAQSGLIK